MAIYDQPISKTWFVNLLVGTISAGVVLCPVALGDDVMAQPVQVDQPVDVIAKNCSAVPLTRVTVQDDFWSPRMETNRTVTIPHIFEMCEETGRIANFKRAAGLEDGEFEGLLFNDSDVYKTIEAASYSLAVEPDAELEGYLVELIETIAAAQEDDGYLNTYFTLEAPEEKWTDLRNKHELYCAGHLFEAAVAHLEATGDDRLLNVALKFADLIDSIFGPDRRHDVPGHEEIEIGLMKLYRVTGVERYADLAQFFIDQRGQLDGRESLYGPYCQDHQPVNEQDEMVGHAVRAMYLCNGLFDVAQYTGDPKYMDAVDRLWSDVVSKKLYITGGVGSERAGEAFGEPYDLPNTEAYAETCASIGFALLNHRLMLRDADSRYGDVLERVLYNGFLASVSLSGDRFFYINPLAANGEWKFNHGHNERAPWFACACCPPNIARFMSEIAGMIYMQTDDDVYVNLYIGSETTVGLESTGVTIRQQTEYPWDGKVLMHVDPEEDQSEFGLLLRIPGWVSSNSTPSDLYGDLPGREPDKPIIVLVNGEPVTPEVEQGYARIQRAWSPGDVVELMMSMRVRRVIANPEVTIDAEHVALERGPIVYCVEAEDNGGYVQHLSLHKRASVDGVYVPNVLGGMVVLNGKAHWKRRPGLGRAAASKLEGFTAIPYYAWNHRGKGEMGIWISSNPGNNQALPSPSNATLSFVSASHVNPSDTLAAVNDQMEPERSRDQSIARMTWFDHVGTTEWIQYDFDEARTVDRSEIYWYEDADRGVCRIPESRYVLYLDGIEWKPVTLKLDEGPKADTFDSIYFEPVETDAIRVVVQLQGGFSAGILEWHIW